MGPLDLADSATRQMVALPSPRTFEKGVVVSVDVNTGLVTYTVDDIEHEALTISGFMPIAGQPVQIAVNGNDRLVLPPAGVDPSLYGTIQTGEGPVVNPNPLEDSANLVGWDASFGVTTWQFDTTTESWSQPAGNFTLAWDGTTGQNENGGGGVVGSLKCTALKNGNLAVLSPIVTTFRDPDLATLASVWVRAGQGGSDSRTAHLDIRWYDSTGTTLEKVSVGEVVLDINASEWTSLNVSDFGPANPLSNKALIQIEFQNCLKGDVFYVDNGLLMAPPNATIALTTPGATSEDTFNRADSTTSIATGAPITWTVRSGTWGINGNRAYLATHAGGLTDGFNAVTTQLPTPSANFVMEVVAGSSGATMTDTWGMVYRYSATNNYWRIEYDTGFGLLILYKVVAGVTTQALVGIVGGLDPGDIVRLECDGNWHRLWLNGTNVGEVNDSFNSTQTNHGLLAGNATSFRWDNFRLMTIEEAYVHAPRRSSMQIAATAGGIAFARTPGDIVFEDLPAVRRGEYWTVSAYVKQRRANATNLYLFAVTIYDKDGNFLQNDFGGGFGPSNKDWRYMISAFEIKHPLAARMRVNVAMLASAANDRIYVSDLHLHKASVVTAPILRTADVGPRLETLPTPTGPQVRVFKSDDPDIGFSRMLHGIARGPFNVTTDATGYVTFPHGLGTGDKPLCVMVQGTSPDTGSNIPMGVLVDTWDTVNVTCRFTNQSGSAIANVQLGITMLVIAPF